MEEQQSKISLKQLTVLLFCGLLSPMIRQVPWQLVRRAGAGGWLGPLLALPVFLLALWLLTAGFRCLPQGAGLGELYQLAFGRALGRLATVATVVWLLLLTAVGLRFYAEDFVSSIYRDTNLWLYLVGLMAIVWWVSCRGLGTACRMSQIFFYGLCLIVGLVMVVGAPEVELYHVWPFWLGGWGELAGAALPVLAVLWQSVPILFHRNGLSRSQAGLEITAAWFAVLCLVLSALNLIIIGVFGWQTVERMQMPFFSLAKEGSMLSTLNIVERLESVVVGVWVFSDLALFSAQLLAAGELTRGVLPRLNSRWVISGMSVVVILWAVWISPTKFQLQDFWEQHVLSWDWCMGCLLPLTACGAVKLRQRWQHKKKAQDMVEKWEERHSI